MTPHLKGYPVASQNELHNTTILLMRHAEKPDDSNDPNLSPAGEARANALVNFIQQHYGHNPDYLFATADSKDSSRPRETLLPLSNAIGVPIDSSIPNDDTAKLVNELETDPKYDGKFIVIAWHHGKIPQLAEELGAPAGTYPAKWNGKDFDDTIEFDFGPDGIPTVKEVPENINVSGSSGLAQR